MDSEQLKEIMRRCMREIAKLAEQPDFEPQIAGKRWKPTEEEMEADLEAAAKSKEAKSKEARAKRA